MIDLRLGDCLEIMRDMPAASVDAVITDPPYGLDPKQPATRTDASGTFTASPTFEGDTFSTDWLYEISRVLKVGGWCLSFVDNKKITTLWDAGKSAGLKPRQTVIWQKKNLPPTFMPWWVSNYESMVAFSNGKVRTWNGGGARRNVIQHANTSFTKAQGYRLHPTQKPVGLMRELIELLTNEGDIILDPFAGSASTLIAAIETGRDAIGIEINPQYFEIAQRRIAEAQAQLTLNFAEATA